MSLNLGSMSHLGMEFFRDPSLTSKPKSLSLALSLEPVPNSIPITLAKGFFPSLSPKYYG